ncbi:AP2 domain-containing protein [Burkholderia vietnamiensis]|uniref:AP2 domain-containing protein n=1 Tax=Burkholderia vietnamiensis TaxID=60552 RepID=UPI001ABA7224|nr:AP2 domain-containing protein [Burkholderia vietnamiensis]WHU91032.1 AP2 domain-containing protein [Burkholderia vietnamiensis]
MKEIPLTKGFVALVDDEDFEALSKYRWHVTECGRNRYAERSVREGKRVRKILMHREILQPHPGMHVDHRDGDGLNNQRANLREATRSQNQHNRGKSCNNTSGYKGVSRHSRDGSWAASISKDGKHINLGYYATPELAYGAYCRAAEELHGEFKRIE